MGARQPVTLGRRLLVKLQPGDSVAALVTPKVSWKINLNLNKNFSPGGESDRFRTLPHSVQRAITRWSTECSPHSLIVKMSLNIMIDGAGSTLHVVVPTCLHLAH